MAANPKAIPRYSSLIGIIDDLRARDRAAPVALVLGKIDGVGGLNSRFGYAIGDQVIETFYAKLSGIARDNDIALEISSNSFAFVIHAPLHEGHVMLAAKKIARIAEEWVQINDSRMRLDVSMGCALVDSPATTSEQLLAEAEKALLRCRSCDRRMLFYDPAFDITPTAAIHPQFDAHKAIQNGEFRVQYQPQLDLRTRKLVGAEALVRWSGPDGLVSPASFMTELERAHSMLPLLYFVMNNASRELARWTRRAPGIKVAINASAADLEHTDLVEVMRDVLGMWHVEPANLKLEITETSLMRDPAVGIRTLSQLRELGVRISIDDFGTGYSNLTWLKDLPVDELKIDRSFVRNIIDNRKDRRIVESIISLAHAMELQVVAEGIEAEGVLHVLRDAGCDTGQGYFFSQPMTAQEFERCWLVASHTAEPATT